MRFGFLRAGVLLLLSLALGLGLMVMPSYAATPWWDANWNYRQQLGLSHQLGSDLPAGTPVRLRLSHAALVAAGRAKTGGEDVRVAYYNPVSEAWEELDRIAEQGANYWNVASPAITDIWFRTKAAIPAGTVSLDYYVYYGNPAALSAPESRANIFVQASRPWDTGVRWSAGTTGGGTRAVGNTLQLAPVSATLVPNSSGSEAYHWFNGNGYVSGSSAPPAVADPGWVRMSDATKLNSASNESDSQAVWETRVTTGRDQWDWTKVKFRLPVNKVLTLNTKWKGWGDDSNNFEYLFVLNQSNSQWEQVQSGQFRTKATAGTLQIDLSTLANQYVNSSGDVWVAAGARHGNYAPYAPTLSSPANGTSYNDAGSVTLQFTRPSLQDLDSDAVTYTVYFNTTSGGSGGTAYAPTFSGNTGSVTVSIPSNVNAYYYWTVRASDGSLTTPSSTWYVYNNWTGDDPPPPDDTSCPFVYYWTGDKYEYVTDLHGQSLGLGGTTKALVPLPRLKADAAGDYKLRVREVMTEVDYFDEARLFLVDVPEGYQIYSTTAEDMLWRGEKNPHKLYTVRNPKPPTRATTSDGRDITAVLADFDGTTAPIFETEPNWYELDFGRVEHPEHAKLLLDGWVKLGMPPARLSGNLLTIIEVVGKDGAWVDSGKRISQFAGASKDMVVDIANIWPTDDHRIRLRNFGSIKTDTRGRSKVNFVDRLRLDDSAPVEMVIREAPMKGAELTHPGMPTVLDSNEKHSYVALDDVAKRQYPARYLRGAFTKLGDVRPLLIANDDMFVVMQHGDALQLTFSDDAPVKPGISRIPVLLADVPYTSGKSTGNGGRRSTGPLPFEGMSKYPYAAPEHYPDDPAHVEYQRGWLTRVYDEAAIDKAVADIQNGGSAPLELQGAADGSPEPENSLNTDYLGVTYSRFVSPSTYYTEEVTLPQNDQFAKISASLSAGDVDGTGVSVEVTADGVTYQSIEDGGSIIYAPDPNNKKLRFKVTLTTTDPTVSPVLNSLVANYETRRIYSPEPNVAVNALVEERDIPPPVKMVSVSDGDSLTPALAIPGQNNVPVLRFQMATSIGETAVNSISLNKLGTGAWSEISRVRVWRDGDNNNGTFEPSSDAVVGQSVPSGNSFTVSMNPSQAVTSDGAKWFFVSYDLAEEAAAGGTLGADLTALALGWGDTLAGGLPVTSQTFAVTSLSDGVPATPGAVLTVRSSNDSDPALGGLQTRLYGSAGNNQGLTVKVTTAGESAPYRETPVTADGTGAWETTLQWLPGRNTVEVVDAGTEAVLLTFEVDVIDPEGTVYNSLTGLPVTGATVRILNPDDSEALPPVTTGGDGRYSFLVPPGEYRMTVTAPGYGSVPTGSVFVNVPEGNGLGTTPGSADGAYRDIYFGGDFEVVAVPLHFDIPMDPVGVVALGLAKVADRSTASAGDVVTWRLKLTNQSPIAMTDIRLTDVLPAEFTYLAGSSVRDGERIADPAITPGKLAFNLPPIAAGTTVWLSYRTVVSAGGAPGVYTNTAFAHRSGNEATRLSQEAAASVRITRDPLLQLSTVLGHVFADTNGNGLLDQGETGLAGVRMLFEDGITVTTDQAGRFHVGGVLPGTKFLKVDTSSLPKGYALATENPLIVNVPVGAMATVPLPAIKATKDQTATASGAGASKATSLKLLAGEVVVTEQGTEGRLAGYFEGTLSDKYKVKASLDTARRKGEEQLTEEPYLTYGDQSRVNRSIAETDGPLYLSVKWDRNEALVGNFRVPAAGGDGQEGYGARIKMADIGADKSTPATVTAYAATLNFPTVRDTVRGTDGSLYYLSHRPAIVGTERVRVEVRDPVTQRLVAEYGRYRGRDYHFDYLGGRLIFTEPVPAEVSSGALYGLPLENDLPVFVVVDYQYDPATDFAPDTYGGRLEANLTERTKLGVSLAASGENGAALLSGDLAGKLGMFTNYRVELGHGRTSEMGSYISNDGGISYTAEAIAATEGSRFYAEVKSDLGQALRDPGLFDGFRRFGRMVSQAVKSAQPETPAAAGIGQLQPTADFEQLKRRRVTRQPLTLEQTSFLKDKVSLSGQQPQAEWLAKPGALTVEGSFKQTTEGYSDGSAPATAEGETAYAAIKAKPAEGSEYKVEASQQTDATNVNRKVDASIKVQQGRAALTTQLGVVETGPKSGDLAREQSIGAKYEYKVTNALTLSVGRKVGYDQSDLNANTYGAVVTLGRFKGSVEQTDGAATQNLKLALSAEPVAGTRYYSTYESDETRGVNTNHWAFGGSTQANDRVRLYAERKLDANTQGVADTNLLGAEYQASEKLGFSVAVGGGSNAAGDDRSTSSVSLSYRPSDALRASSSVELSTESGATAREETTARLRADWMVTPEVTLVGRVVVAQTTGAGYTGGNESEVAVGGAYRPVRHDRLNLFGQYVVRRGNPDETGVGEDTEDSTRVVSLESGYRFTKSFSLVEKLAWKRATTGADGSEASADTYLWANRFVYHVTRQWEAAAEYRMVKQGDNLSKGPVLELDFAIPGAEAIKVGFGYNYAGFGDTLLGDENESGWFLKLRGVF